MAAKKKTGSASGAAVGKKMKTSSTPNLDTYKGQKIDWKTPGKPTEAITNKGQKATGLAKSPVAGNRFSSTAKTTSSTGIFAGTGTPLGAGKMFNITKGNVANAALTVVGGGVSTNVAKVASRAVDATRLAVGTEKMIRRMMKESGIKPSKTKNKK